MDIEQLTLILDAARAAGDGAMQVVFVWFALQFFTIVVEFGTLAGFFYAAYRIAVRAIASASLAGDIARVTGQSMSAYSSGRAKFLTWLQHNWKDST